LTVYTVLTVVIFRFSGTCRSFRVGFAQKERGTICPVTG